MKKRGFTLVELIAVIVVLAIISLIAVPRAMNYIESARQESYKTSVRGVFEAVNNYIASSDEMEELPSSGIFIPDDKVYQDLKLKNQDFISGKIYRDTDGVIKVDKISNGVYCASGSKTDLVVSKGTCDKLDATEPDVSLYVSRVTKDSITIVVNSKDEDSGILGYKYYLGETLKEEKKDNVYTFTGLEANKKYTIKVTSTNGNNLETTKTIEVTTNSTKITWKQEPEGWARSKTITITCPSTSEKEVCGYNVVGTKEWITISGKATLQIENDTTITARLLKEGTMMFYETRTFGQIDKEAPIIDSIEGNKAEYTISKKIVINARDLKSGLADEAYSFNDEDWQSSNSKVFTENGSVTIKVRDKVGNEYKLPDDVIITTVDPTVITKSTITATAGGEEYTSGSWTNKDVILVATPTPTGAPSGYNYQWYKKVNEAWEATGTGMTLKLSQNQTTTYKVEIGTKAGSAKVMSEEFTVNIDKTPPTCEWNGENTTWTTTTQTIKVSCKDEESGCATEADEHIYNTTTKTAEITYLATDVTGNSTTCIKTAANVYVDKTKPTVTITGTTASTRLAAVNFTVSDEHSGLNNYTCTFGTASGSGTINYNLTGTVTTSGTTISCKRDKLSANTTYYYKITAKDKLGNTATSASSITTKSFSDITYTVSDETTYTQTKTVKITGVTEGAELQYQVLDYSAWVAGTASVSEDNWVTISSGTTIPTITNKSIVYARLTDGYNVYSADAKVITNIDITKPAISTVTRSSTTNSITLKYAVTDLESGVSTHKCYFKNNTYTNGYIEGTANNTTGCTISGLKNNITYDYKIETTDKAGNENTITGQWTTGDFTDPSVTVPSGWAKSKTVTINGATTGAQLQYKIGSSGTWTNISNGGTVTITENTTVYARLWDGTNESKHATGTINQIDTTAPSVPTSTIRYGSSTGTVRTNANTWTNQTLWWGNFSATDSESGINHYEYSTDCTGTVSGTLSSSYTYDTDRNWTFCIRSVDNAGNASSWSSAYYFKIDKTPPTITYDYSDLDSKCSDGTDKYGYVCSGSTPTVKVTCSDSGSGVESFIATDKQWTCDSKSNTTGTTIEINICSTSTDDRPYRNVDAYCVDKAKDESGVESNTTGLTSVNIKRTRSDEKYNCTYENPRTGEVCGEICPGDSCPIKTSTEGTVSGSTSTQDTTVSLTEYCSASSGWTRTTTAYSTTYKVGEVYKCTNNTAYKYTGCVYMQNHYGCTSLSEDTYNCYYCTVATKTVDSCTTYLSKCT